jgi:putative flavoprotein involved in K+ transport
MKYRSIATVVIGAGHNGLAMSRCLAELGIEHIVLERGEVANTWRHERWDSLRLLTPNWLSRLPGYAYGQEHPGADPDGFMGMAETVGFITGYALATEAPVMTQTTVERVEPADDGYTVITNQGVWRCRSVVMANGAFSIPKVPKVSLAAPNHIQTITPKTYKRPDQLADGGVLVVGASASGIQLAREIHQSGRPVTLATGEHVRMPRTYRGRDILWWMDATGRSDEHIDEVDDPVRVRRVPSPQLIGTPDRSTVDLNTLTDIGVELVGRVCNIRDGVCQTSGDLRNLCKMADLKGDRLLRTIDEWVAEHSATRTDVAAIADSPPVSEELSPTRVPDKPRMMLDLNSGEISTIVWATGYRPDYSWLKMPVFDHKGQLRHDGGVVRAPGLYVMGHNFMRRRKSSFIHGAEDDARDLSQHLAAYLAGEQRKAAGWP